MKTGIRSIPFIVTLFLFAVALYAGNDDRGLPAKDTFDQQRKSPVPNYYTGLEIGLQKGLSNLWNEKFENEGYYINVDLCASFQVYENFSLGPGMGVNTYAYGTYIPVYMNLRYHLGKGKIVPIITANTGFSFGWPKNDIEGSEWAGLMFNPGLSFALRIDEQIKYYIKFAYKYQKMKTQEINFNSIMVDAEFLEFKFGFIF